MFHIDLNGKRFVAITSSRWLSPLSECWVVFLDIRFPEPNFHLKRRIYWINNRTIWIAGHPSTQVHSTNTRIITFVTIGYFHSHEAYIIHSWLSAYSFSLPLLSSFLPLLYFGFSPPPWQTAASSFQSLAKWWLIQRREREIQKREIFKPGSRFSPVFVYEWTFDQTKYYLPRGKKRLSVFSAFGSSTCDLSLAVSLWLNLSGTKA